MVGPMFDLKYSVYMIIIKGFIDVSFVFINNGKIWILIAKLWITCRSFLNQMTVKTVNERLIVSLNVPFRLFY